MTTRFTGASDGNCIHCGFAGFLHGSTSAQCPTVETDPNPFPFPFPGGARGYAHAIVGLEIARAVFDALAPVDPNDRLGMLAGLVIGSLRAQGLDWEAIDNELTMLVKRARAYEAQKTGSEA